MPHRRPPSDPGLTPEIADLVAEVRADQVVARLLHERVAVSTAEPFSTSEQVPHALRLALGSVTLAQLEDALDKVRQAIAHFAY